MSGLSRTNKLLNTVVVQDDRTVIDSDVTVAGAVTTNDIVINGLRMTDFLPYVNDLISYQATKTTVYAGVNKQHHSFGSMNGADNNNTMQDLSSDKITVKNVDQLKLFKDIPLNGDVQNGLGNIYPQVCDEEYLYVIATIGTNTNGTYSNELTMLYKFNKWSGEFIVKKSFADIFGTTVPYLIRYQTPTPPSIAGDYLYLMHPGNLQFAKLDKNLNVIWMKNDVFDISKDFPAYYRRSFDDLLAVVKHGGIEVIQKDDGKILICLSYCHLAQYGMDLATPLYNFVRTYDGQYSGSGIYCVRDYGTYTSNLWNFRTIPKKLEAGSNLPAEALAPGASNLRIAYPIVAGKTGFTRDGPYESCNLTVFNSVNNAKDGQGRDIFRFDNTTAGPQRFIAFDYDMNQSNLLDPWKGFIYSNGLIGSNTPLAYPLGPHTFNFSSNQTIVNDSNVFYYSTEGSNYKVSGADIFLGQAVIKRLESNVVLNKFDAYAANYYGCSVWGKITYDSNTNTVYGGIGQPHKRPLEDYFIASNNNIVFSDYVTRYNTASSNFLLTSNFASISNAYNALTTTDLSSVRWENTFSPRTNRLCGSGIVALDLDTGALNWKHSALKYDDWVWASYNFPHYTQWPTNIANADVVAGVTITSNATRGRMIVYADKSCHAVAFPASNNYYTVPSRVGDLMCDNGVAAVNNVVPYYKTMCGLAGTYGGFSFGSTATNGSNMVMYCVNVPIGTGGSLLPNYYNQEEVPYNGNVGWVASNGLVKSNALTDARVKQYGSHTLMPTGVKYVAGLNLATGVVDYYAPLEDLYFAVLDIVRDVPYAIENYPITMTGDVAMVGNARGRLMFLDGNNGKLLKYLTFPEGITSAFACDNVVYTLGGTGKRWGSPNVTTSPYIRMITPYGL